MDVQEFERYMMKNILELHTDLTSGTYQHGGYHHFKISDPKPRDIHKASVRDRLVHHAIYRQLYPFFDRTFIPDSYSCRKDKGTHKAMNRFRSFAQKVSKNDTLTCWVLKCYIRKFFASIDQHTLLSLIDKYVPDERVRALFGNIVGSFNSGTTGKGLPLGNLTSQLLVNIYMNEFDQFVKHKLKAKYYIRYSDDFVFFLEDKERLDNVIAPIKIFLKEKLRLRLHPKKIHLKTLASGMDFLGMVNFFDHRILRTKTKKRILRKMKEKKFLWREDLISEEKFNQSLQSYLGMLTHCRGRKIADILTIISI